MFRINLEKLYLISQEIPSCCITKDFECEYWGDCIGSCILHDSKEFNMETVLFETDKTGFVYPDDEQINIWEIDDDFCF